MSHRVHFVRHADAGSRSHFLGDDRDLPLSTLGWRQARWIAALLADVPLERLVSSPYRRCRETLAPLAARRGLPVEDDERLAEGSDVGGVLAWMPTVGPAVLCSHGDVVAGSSSPSTRPGSLSRGGGAGIKGASGSSWSRTGSSSVGVTTHLLADGLWYPCGMTGRARLFP